ncbi:hypothetical protein NK917_23990, partial [Salmonella enterica subsp. enterica serovar Typhimurium]|uniref:hypothetical protein n=1 Tax=Salmonella enterica TaxID=28901 RepID=UPI0020A34299
RPDTRRRRDVHDSRGETGGKIGEARGRATLRLQTTGTVRIQRCRLGVTARVAGDRQQQRWNENEPPHPGSPVDQLDQPSGEP